MSGNMEELQVISAVTSSEDQQQLIDADSQRCSSCEVTSLPDQGYLNKAIQIPTPSSHNADIIATKQFQSTSQPYILMNGESMLPTKMEDNADMAWFYGFLTCFCCFLPLGMSALYFANKAGKCFKDGEYQDGIYYRRFSYLMSLLAIFAGVAFVILITQLGVLEV